MAHYSIGVDLGGTKVAAAVADRKGGLRGSTVLPTEVSQGPEHVAEQVFRSIDIALETSGVPRGEIDGIGIGSPGPLSVRRGVVIQAPNLGWREVPIRRLISERFGIRCYLDNDANVAALAEQRFGVARGLSNIIYVTVSTGIGAGIIVDGRLYRGSGDYAGELGHSTVLEDGPLCKCGNRGCLEALSSGTAIARRARERVGRADNGILLELAGGSPEAITVPMVAEADRLGDPLAREVIDSAIRYLGIGLSNLVNLLNPEAIVVGGGVSKLGARLLIPLRRAVKERSLPAPGGQARVLLAELGDEVGVIGAAALVTGDLG